MMFSLCFFIFSETAIEIGPILPKNMVNITIYLPNSFSVAVRFLVKPTVPVALNISYITSRMPLSVVSDRSIVEIKAIVSEIKAIAEHLFMVALLICLLKTETEFLPFITEIVESSKTAKVTVFMPPAVPTGEPPMNISIIESTDEAVVRFSCGREAKPAVLVVTD